MSTRTSLRRTGTPRRVAPRREVNERAAEQQPAVVVAFLAPEHLADAARVPLDVAQQRLENTIQAVLAINSRFHREKNAQLSLTNHPPLLPPGTKSTAFYILKNQIRGPCTTPKYQIRGPCRIPFSHRLKTKSAALIYKSCFSLYLQPIP